MRLTATRLSLSVMRGIGLTCRQLAGACAAKRPPLIEE
jgi:hypothetical protein